MKKILSVIALAFAAMLAMAGCVNVNADINVKGIDKATGAVDVTMNKQNLNGMSFEDALAQGIDMDELKSQLGDDWSTSEITEGENVGLHFETTGTMTYQELQDAFAVFGIPFELKDNNQEFTFTMPGTDAGSVSSEFTEAKVNVTFPGGVESQVNGETDHHTVTFDLIKGAEKFQAVGKVDNTMFYTLVIGGALLVLTLIVVGAFAPKGVKEAH